ncbi:MAG: hypothetical protein D6695_00865 [Planctomycetota bacterium]|nr:MAG: hypothetical protein D6695_00865 [Planctomycetota bacterium]
MSTKPDDNLNLTAGILAVVFPGAGHLYLRQTRRAVLAAVGVLGLFFSGMFVGGIDVIDRKEDKWWFLAQAMVGPLAFGVDAYHQHALKAYPLDPNIIAAGEMQAADLERLTPRALYPGETRKTIDLRLNTPAGQMERTIAYIAPAGPGQGPPSTKSIGMMNELGMLSAAIAGMLNFIIVLDAFFPGPSSASREPR